jgi:hypothetical protein
MKEQEESKNHIKTRHHDDPSHNNKLREINKANYISLYDTENNYAQTTYDSTKDFKIVKEVDQDISNKKTKNVEGSMNEAYKDFDYNTDETMRNKNEKDFESVPSEHEKINKKMNKRLNKELVNEDLQTIKYVDQEKFENENMREKGIVDKTKEFVNEGIEKAKDFFAKF